MNKNTTQTLAIRPVFKNWIIVLAMIIAMPAMRVRAQCDAWKIVGGSPFTGISTATAIAFDATGNKYVGYCDIIPDSVFFTFRLNVIKNNGTAWSYVGSTAVSDAWVTYLSLVISSTGIPYVGYYDNSHQKVVVKKFTGSSWENVGGAYIDSGNVRRASFAVGPDDALYIAYTTVSPSPKRCVVKKFNGATWDTLGTTAPESAPNAVAIAVSDGGTVYRFFSSTIPGGEGVVQKYDGSTWVNVGSPIGDSLLNDKQILIDHSGTPYIAYGLNDGYVGRVKKFDGTDWVTVWGDPITPVNYMNGILALDPSGVPYIARDLTADGNNAIIQKFNGTSWDQVAVGEETFFSALGFDNAGVLHGVYYTHDSLCLAEKGEISSMPPIHGPAILCPGGIATLSNSVGMGHWSSSDTTIVQIDSATGIVTGVTYGTSTISYQTGSCSSFMVVTVNMTGYTGVISGPASVCAGATVTMTPSVGGGAWSIASAFAGIDENTGVVNGIAAGMATISYTLGGCTTTQHITIDPYAGWLSGSLSVNVGATTTMHSTVAGGTWSTSNGNGSITAGGALTGIAAGNTIVSYAVSGSCGTNYSTYAVDILPTSTACSNWTDLGTPPDESNIWDNTLVTAPDGTMYRANFDGTAWGPHVYRFDGSNWQSMGVEALPIYTAGYVFTVSNNGTPYLAATSGGYGKLLAYMHNGTDWVALASPPDSLTNCLLLQIKTDAAGTPYILFMRDPLWQLTLLKYNGSGWDIVGSPNFSGFDASINWGRLAFYGTTPYVATGGGSDHGMKVMKYNGVNWETQGATGKTSGYGIGGNQIVISSTGVPYLMYNNTVTNNMEIMKYEGGTWTPLGTDGILGYSGPDADMKFDNNGSLYVTNLDADGFLMLRKYDGTTFQPVGGQVDPNYAASPALTFDNNNTPYVYVLDFLYAWSSSVRKYTSLGGMSAITGSTTTCVGSTISLANATTGGTWSSSNTSVATVGAADGIVTGVAAGTTIISYSNTSCATSLIVTVNAAASVGAISGTATVCNGAMTTLTNATPGGFWSSSDASVATVDASTGIVTGTGAGNATITYSISNCGTATATKQVTVNAITTAGTITGSLAICPSANTTLSDAATGGTWSSSNTAVATVNAATGVVTGAATGTTTITYSVNGACGAAAATAIVTVSTTVNAGTITGAMSLCPSANTTLSNAITGGTWSSSTTAVATIDASTGVVSGVTAGTSTITYTVSGSCGAATATAVVTVNATTTAGTITGTTTVCTGATTTLSNAVTGGTWSSSNTAVATINTSTGVVSGASVGNTTITYTKNGACGAATTTAVVTVNAATTAGTITGTKTVCAGANTTLGNATTGGTWSSSNTGVATVNASTGVVSGVSGGSTNITYTVNGTCGAANTTAVVTVNGAPSAGTISGGSTVAIGGAITLTDAVTGGTWSASNGNATVNSTGVVTGVTAGTTTISYTVNNSCGSNVATTIVTVSAGAPSSITGTLTVCGGSTTTLSSTPGGVWSSMNNAIASVGSTTGIVSGVAPGVITIKYTLAGIVTTVNVTVNGQPNGISGPAYLCQGATITLSSTATGATWSSSNTAVATIGSTGVVSGVAAGSTTISLTGANGCARTAAITVNGRPDITGIAALCAGTTTTLSTSMTGGAWGGGSAVATVSNGVVTGYNAGTTYISYTANGCANAVAVTVNAAPAAITGTLKVCPAMTTALADATTGGTWSSNSTGVATIDAGGAVTAVTAGTAVITYTNSNSCYKTAVFTVNPSPAAISGTTSACAGSTTALSNSSAAYSWTSGNTSIATVSSTGVVTGVSAGTATITFMANGTWCTTSTVVTINGTPAAIAGASSVCIGTTATLSNTMSGGVWTSSNPAAISIDVNGIVTGVATGTTTITYNVGGCYKTKVMTTSTSTNSIQGYPTICTGTTATLTSWGTGTWSSSNSAVASIATPASGYVTGMTSGNATITFFPATDCYITYPVTVVAAPGAITGTTSICSGDVSSLSVGSTGGTWSSSNTATATIGAANGAVTGVGSAGTVIITYAIGNSCRATATLTVKPIPAAITGTYSVCATATTTLVDVTAGGVWSSSNTSVATVGTGITWGHGAVSGITAGTTTISFTVPATGCARSVVVTVDPCSRPMGNEQSASYGLQLYPNPTTGAIMLETSTNGVLTVFTVDGKQVSTYAIAKGINNLTLPRELAAGVYMCRFSGNDGNTTVVRLVVQ